MLHQFAQPIAHIALPEKFTYPFHYTPHPLCMIAANELQDYIATREEWKEELQQGKMFGVLIVQTSTGELGYITAFSGNLAGKNQHPFFVPPVYDLLQPKGFFKIEEENISLINKQIRQIEEDASYLKLQSQLSEAETNCRKELKEAKEVMKAAKEKREALRRNNLCEEEQTVLIRESQFQKAEYKRLERSWKERISTLQMKVDNYSNQVEELKKERKVRSAALQQKLFEQYRMLNALGEEKDLCRIFEDTVQKVPPAGAGECAAPKLLQYAYQQHWKPIAMAEFWWGDSPKMEIRRHGHYYPACKGKCEPILKHMLQGLRVEDNPLSKDVHQNTALEILYEDEWLAVINKPAGVLSVPGKINADSIHSRLQTLYPHATGPMIVHRLDMATSGLLLIAKTKDIHKHLQAQFKDRAIKKRYTALLEGNIKENTGVIDLPICPSPTDRPRQIVSTEHGKPAITRYEVIEHRKDRTLVSFYPLTGRTHQLRVHSAHSLGLNAPIVGDELYGKKADRLYLHAEYLEFKHPVSGKIIQIEKKADF